MQFGPGPKINNVLAPIYHLTMGPDANWSLAQVQFGPGLESDLVLGSNETWSWVQMQFSRAQMWYVPCPKCVSGPGPDVWGPGPKSNPAAGPKLFHPGTKCNTAMAPIPPTINLWMTSSILTLMLKNSWTTNSISSILILTYRTCMTNSISILTLRTFLTKMLPLNSTLPTHFSKIKLVRFGPGPKCDFGPGPKCDWVLGPNAIYSRAQLRHGPGPKVSWTQAQMQ